MVGKIAEIFGATEAQLSELFSVSSHTIRKWVVDYPEFGDAVTIARARANSRVERCLFERATGYTHEVEKVFCNKDGDVTIAKYNEHIAPDATAMIFWLKNRERESWRDVNRTEITGSEGAPLPIINITLNTMAGEQQIKPAIDMTKAKGGSLEFHRKKGEKRQLARDIEQSKD